MSGLVRRIDTLGRLVIPKEMRDMLNIRANDLVDFYLEKDKVIVTKHSEGQVEEMMRLCGAEIEREIGYRVVCTVGDEYVYGVNGDTVISMAVDKLRGRTAYDIAELPIGKDDVLYNVSHFAVEIKGMNCGIIAPTGQARIIELIMRILSGVVSNG